MLTGTLITAAGFLPVGFAKSGAGEYVFSLFQVVGISLMLSWIVAVLFTPYLGFKLLPEHQGRRAARRGRGVPARLLRALPQLRRLVPGASQAGDRRHRGRVRRRRSRCSSVVPQQFFPASDRPELMVDLWLPQAATFEASQREVARARSASCTSDPDVVAVTSYVGTGSPRFYLPLDVQTPNLNLGELMVMTKGGEARERVLAKIAAAVRERLPARARPRQPAGERPAGRLSGAVPRLRQRQRRRCRPSPTRCRRSCAPTRTCAASTRTGASASSACASTSTRTRRARSASRSRADQGRAAGLAVGHARSRSTAKATTTSTWWRA